MELTEELSIGSFSRVSGLTVKALRHRVMAEQLEERGLTAAGAPVEWYESDPQQVPDPKDYVTIIEWPLVSE